MQYNKAQFLQDRNPGVPGIIYKICPENEDQRKLDQARALWRATVDITKRPIREIYTGREIGLDVLSIDHFVPRSYISNDELWNLTPMSKSLNSSKTIDCHRGMNILSRLHIINIICIVLFFRKMNLKNRRS